MATDFRFVIDLRSQNLRIQAWAINLDKGAPQALKRIPFQRLGGTSGTRALPEPI
jgi:hypothetical protein